MKYLIIGAGIAGTTAAEELRKLDAGAEIILVSEEPHALYSRVLLPHYIKGKISRERVFLKKESWYDTQKIEWLRGEFVKELDTVNKFVRLSNEREFSYDKLLIATGGELNMIPSDTRGVSYLRTLDDADHLIQLLKEQGTSCIGAIYGGGFIACEYLNIFSHFNIPTTIALRGAHFWSGLLHEEGGALISSHLEKNSVDVHHSSAFEGVDGVLQVEALRTTTGIFPCSVLGVGIGIAPELSWLARAGVEIGNGVKTDMYLRTNIENVFAVGDIAEFYDTVTERYIRVGNWMNAQMQGRVVAKNMTGQDSKFELVSSYATNALGLEIIFVGDVSKEHSDKIEIHGSTKEGGVTQLFFRSGYLVGGIMIGRNKDRTAVTSAIRSRIRGFSI